MIVISTFIEALAQLLHMVISLYIWVIIIASLISWVKPDLYNPIVQILYKLTEPIYSKVREFIPSKYLILGAIDLTPIIVILGLQFADLFIVKLLFKLAGSN